MINSKKVIPYKEPKQQELRYAVADWIVSDGISFNTVNGKGFKRMIKKVNAAFIPPCYATLKRDIGMGYKTSINLMNTLIDETCLNASITVDLWTSRAKTGYVGITCHWLTQKMELRDVLVCVDQISYPHTGKHIYEVIQQKLEVLGLQNKINVVITDNGSNMIKAIEYWNGVERVGYTAHTLQLCVNKGFKIITP